jgi:hypothetical protein
MLGNYSSLARATTTNEGQVKVDVANEEDVRSHCRPWLEMRQRSAPSLSMKRRLADCGMRSMPRLGRRGAAEWGAADARREADPRRESGYPYFLQEYGKHVWNVAPGPTITLADVKRAHELVQLELDESFFRVRIGRATKAELAYLAAMASLGDGPYRSGEIAAKLGRPGPESVAPTRARLIEKALSTAPPTA